MPIAKGQTRLVKVGLIVDDDIKDETYVEIGISPSTKISYDEGSIYKDITSYCVKLFE